MWAVGVSQLRIQRYLNEFPEFSALGDHNHARCCARNTVSKTEQISLRNLPNVYWKATNFACGRPRCYIRRDRRADLVREVPLDCRAHRRRGIFECRARRQVCFWSGRPRTRPLLDPGIGLRFDLQQLFKGLIVHLRIGQVTPIWRTKDVADDFALTRQMS
jgi:hypothetical protein